MATLGLRIILGGMIVVGQVLRGQKLAAGDLLGEMALVDAQTRSATAQAKQPTTVIVITAIEFAKRMEKSDPFMRSMVQALTKRLRNMNEARSEDG
jgi:CRP-like cAMP-binding protein